MEQVVESAVSVQGLSAAYGSRKALVNVNVEIPARGITAIIGPSGCGKSTLLSCLNRTIELVDGASASGTVLLEGQDISRMSADDVRVRMKYAGISASVAANVRTALEEIEHLPVDQPLYVLTNYSALWPAKAELEGMGERL